MSHYHSYLLRLWSIGSEGECRIMVEHIGSGERVSFANLESLVDFLSAQAGAADGRAAPDHLAVPGAAKGAPATRPKKS